MEIRQLLLEELEPRSGGDAEDPRARAEGKNDWKPHERSMALGYLATIVATIPSWLDMVVNLDELDIDPPGDRSSVRRSGRPGRNCWIASRRL
jgi:hypothetical protein